MAKQRFTTEEIIHMLREADVLIGQGRTIAEACKQIGVTDKTYFRWRKSHGGLRIDQAKRMRELEAENARLRKAVAIICSLPFWHYLRQIRRFRLSMSIIRYAERGRISATAM
jgi:putative transposase